ncbi:MAG: toll/interleukin-1 receptor domain-containing protein [Bacteroidota bacterium]
MNRKEIENSIREKSLKDVAKEIDKLLIAANDELSRSELQRLNSRYKLLQARFPDWQHYIDQQEQQDKEVNDELTDALLQYIDQFFAVVDNQEQKGEDLEPKYDVFLSYSSKDQAEADKLYGDLISAGLKTFYAKETLQTDVGYSFIESIEKGILNSENFVILCTKNTFASQWVRAEYEAFLNEKHMQNHGGRMILYDLGRFSDDSVPVLLRQFQRARDTTAIINSLQLTSSKLKQNSLEKKSAVKYGKEHSLIETLKTRFWIAVPILLFLLTLSYLFIQGKLSNQETTLINDVLEDGKLDKVELYQALSKYPIVMRDSATIDEAISMLKHIGIPNDSIERIPYAVIGKLDPDLEIAIWPNSYDQKHIYGVRFGPKTKSYIGSNETYFEIP